MQILPVDIKSLGGSVATLANWLTSWVVTMTANLLLSWSEGGARFIRLDLSYCTLFVYKNAMNKSRKIGHIGRNIHHLYNGISINSCFC